MRRATRSPSDESGITLAELLVAMAVLGVVATAAMSVALRTTQTTLTVTDRRDVFADGRFALDQLTEDLRQAESIDVASTSSWIRIPTYVNGTSMTVTWQVTGSAAPYRLERTTASGTVTLLESLANAQLFTYTSHEGVRDQVTVDMTVATSTTSVELTTDVYLRNAD